MDNKFKSVPVKSSEITPYSHYLSRRDFLKAAGLATGTALLAACAPNATRHCPCGRQTNLPQKKDELAIRPTPSKILPTTTTYYEFTTDKQGVAPAVAGFQALALDGGSLRAGQ